MFCFYYWWSFTNTSALLVNYPSLQLNLFSTLPGTRKRHQLSWEHFFIFNCIVGNFLFLSSEFFDASITDLTHRIYFWTMITLMNVKCNLNSSKTLLSDEISSTRTDISDISILLGVILQLFQSKICISTWNKLKFLKYLKQSQCCPVDFFAQSKTTTKNKQITS